MAGRRGRHIAPAAGGKGGMPAPYLYALALGSNRALAAAMTPVRLVQAASSRIGDLGEVRAMSPLIQTAPLGPSLRRYSNAALLVTSPLAPLEMLAKLQQIERDLGRRRHRRWGERRIDIDIILWSGGRWNSRWLTIPHAHFRDRDFVLAPLACIAGDWRDPVSGLTARQLLARLGKAGAGASKRLTSRIRASSGSELRSARALSSVGRATDF